MVLRFILVLGLMYPAGMIAANDSEWSQWRGANRDGRSQETGMLQNWPEGGPQVAWTFNDAGLGYASFSVVDGRLYTMGQEDDGQFVLCLDAATGDELWRLRIGDAYSNNWGDGPRSTPTIDNGYLFALSARGDLVCLTAEEGKMVWTASLVDDFGGDIPTWGYSESVLVDGDQVIATPGGRQGSIVALDRETGEKIWQSERLHYPAHYSSALVAEPGGQRQYIQLLVEQLVGVDAESGRVLWQEEWPGRIAVIPTPLYHDGRVYITSGYAVGSKLVDVSDGRTAEEVWFNKVMKNHHGGVVLVDDHVYGYSDATGWICQELETGEMVWREPRRLGKGPVAYADGRLYCVDETTGVVALVEPTTEGYREHGRFTLEPQSERRKPDGRIWAHPVIADGRLYLRDQEIIYAFDIRGERRASD